MLTNISKAHVTTPNLDKERYIAWDGHCFYLDKYSGKTFVHSVWCRCRHKNQLHTDDMPEDMKVAAFIWNKANFVAIPLQEFLEKIYVDSKSPP